MTTILRIAILAFAAVLALPLRAAPQETPASAPTAPRVDFEKDVRPILARSCAVCHNEKKKRGGLDLSTKRGAFAGGSSGRAILPGNAAMSLLLRRVAGADGNDRMPLGEDPLPDAEAGILRAWIDSGAAWPDDAASGAKRHWAYLPPERKADPPVKDRAACRNFIDAFTLARIEAEGLSPAPEAERPALLRRLSLDLTGLPPTAAEMRAFAADDDPHAFDHAVDRLLASPHFGEKWALAWLDIARYADTNGYEKDLPRTLWPWRDWVIRALNADMPFDAFTVKQLAGDLLPDATADDRVATGFHRNTMLNDEGGIDAEEFRVAAVVDRTNTTATAWLGQTFACAQCHDHKYDPITQREYYAFFAFFNQSEDTGVGFAPEMEITDEEEARRIEALDRADLLESPASGPTSMPSPFLHLPETLVFDGGTEKVIADAANFEKDQAFSYGARVRLDAPGAILAKIDDPGAYRGFDLYDDQGKVQVHIVHHWPDDGLKVESKDAVITGKRQHVFMTYDGSGKASGVAIYVDGIAVETVVANDTLKGSIRTAVPLKIGSRHASGRVRGRIADVRFYSKALSPADVRRLAHEVPPVVETMVLRERKDPRPNYVMNRGDFRQKGAAVTPDVPAFLPPLPKFLPRNRLLLATWLVDKRNPLTARVVVNRLWEALFGQGLVATAEDFGVQGDPPSHPELLDRLAIEFMDHEWSVKALLKTIVSSATYRRSSVVGAAALERDPLNRLFARGPRFRLPAEGVRDQALAFAGLLSEKIGGKSVMPPQPAGIWAESFANFDTPNEKWIEAHGEDRFRRGLYTYWRRSAPYPSTQTFDQPRRDTCVVKRSRSNTPLQALTTLNDPVFVEAAIGFAARILSADRSDGERLKDAFFSCTARDPGEHDLRVLSELLLNSRARFAADRVSAERFVKRTDVPIGAMDPVEVAAWTVITNVLLNLDETLVKG